MNKKLVFLFSLIFISHILTIVPPAEAAVSLTAPSAVLLEPDSKKIIFSRAPHKKMPPASTTKIVTALVVLDSLGLNQWVTVSPRVETVEASKLHLRGGDRLRVRDLLKALLIKSANDAASALAIEISESEHAFARRMTQKAHALGARNTRFANASGLPEPGQYTTAYDLALIMREASKNDVIVSILKQKRALIETSRGRRFQLKSHNKMLWRPQRMIGKTGWTRGSLYCFVGVMDGGGKNTIVAVLGSRKLWHDLRTLFIRVNGTRKESRYGVFSFGSRGDEIKKLQAALRRTGFFKGPATGYFGKITKKAVIDFQRSRNLRADGVVGTNTKKALAPFY